MKQTYHLYLWPKLNQDYRLSNTESLVEETYLLSRTLHGVECYPENPSQYKLVDMLCKTHLSVPMVYSVDICNEAENHVLYFWPHQPMDLCPIKVWWVSLILYSHLKSEKRSESFRVELPREERHRKKGRKKKKRQSEKKDKKQKETEERKEKREIDGKLHSRVWTCFGKKKW